MAQTTRPPSPAANLDLTTVTSSSFLDQPVEDLVLLHSLNSLLASVALPTLHNILDATPYLLIALYEALPPELDTDCSLFKRRKRIPFVERTHPNVDFGTRLKNLKLLVGSIVHDEELCLSRALNQRLVELDLCAFCEKDYGAVREMVDVFVDIAHGIMKGEGGRLGLGRRGLTADTLQPSPLKDLLSEEVTPRAKRGGRVSKPVSATLVGSEASPPGVRPVSVSKARGAAGRFFGVDSDDNDYNSVSFSEGSPNRSSRRRRYDRKHIVVRGTPPLLTAGSTAKGSDYICKVRDDNDTSMLLPLPPSPPQTRYLSLKAIDYFSTQGRAPSARKSLQPRGLVIEQDASIRGENERALPVPRSGRGSVTIKPATRMVDGTLGSEDDSDHTSLISVSPASWGAESLYTAALRKKRANALLRLQCAEGRFQEQVDGRGHSTLDHVVGVDDDDGEEDEEEEEEEEEMVVVVDDNDEEEEMEKEAEILRAERGSIISYEDIEQELGDVEEDGTVQVEKLEELVKALLVRKGYRVVGEH